MTVQAPGSGRDGHHIDFQIEDGQRDGDRSPIPGSASMISFCAKARLFVSTIPFAREYGLERAGTANFRAGGLWRQSFSASSFPFSRTSVLQTEPSAADRSNPFQFSVSSFNGVFIWCPPQARLTASNGVMQ